MPSFDQFRVPLGFALLVVWLLWGQRGEIAGMASKAWGLIPSWPRTSAAAIAPTTIADPDYLELQALKVLDKRFERLKCKEGKAALAVLKKEFFTDHSAEA